MNQTAFVIRYIAGIQHYECPNPFHRTYKQFEPQKSIQEDKEIVDDGNEDKAIREKITGNQEWINALEKERK